VRPRVALLLLTALALVAAASLLLPFGPLRALFETDSNLATAVLAELRLPRTLLALAYGATLGAAGAAVQALFANPLASPDLTGTTSGAALGAVVTAYYFGFAAPVALAVGSVAGALLALLLLLALAGPKAETATLLLAGLAISALAGALTTLALDQAAFAAIPALLVILLLLRLAPALDRLALGEEVAQSLGHDVRRLRLQVVCLTALGVGACVAICGAIGFIGLIAPIFARRLVRGHPGRAILPAALIGALLLTASDLAVRLAPLGRTLPIGVVTALIGVPFFLWLVVNMRWRVTS
jgi:iron complex transport system permease protein